MEDFIIHTFNIELAFFQLSYVQNKNQSNINFLKHDCTVCSFVELNQKICDAKKEKLFKKSL